MSERNYYVLCDDNCRFEGMTKEQIFDAIAAATGVTPTPVDEAFITKVKEQNAQTNLKFWKGTTAQFNALETKDRDTIYFVGINEITEDGGQNIVPISRGGTGATTEESARGNLGAAPAYQYGTEDLTAGVTPLPDGILYFVYEV